MLEYQIVKSNDSSGLSFQVNALLKDGWELRGELIVGYVDTRPHDGLYYHQVMIKERTCG